MKFIFPKNYNFKPKLLGFLDYSTAIVNGVCALLLYLLSSIICTSLSSKISLFVALYFPIFLFSIFSFQQENILSVLTYTFLYVKSQKIYLYKKEALYFEPKEKTSKH